MNSYRESIARFYAVSLVIAAFLFCASISPAFGQERSTDRDNPTPLTANVITDDLDGTDTAYFYKFAAGPGKLTVTIEVKASGTNAGAMLDLFDARSRPILSDVLAQGVDGGSERIVNSVQLSAKRDIVMRVKGLKYGDTGGTGTYKITLDGPLIVGQAAAPAPAPAAAAGNDPAGGGGAPAPVGSNLLQGQLDPADERSLFHIVNITGPGQVTFGFSVKAADTKFGATFAVMTQEGTLALPPLEVRGGESISKVVTFDKAQALTMVVAVSRSQGNAGRGTYSVQLSGPAGAAAPTGSNSVSGKLDPAIERPSFHFVNVNGPGQVTFSFSVKAIDAKAGARVAVMTQNGREALPALELQGGESTSKPITFDKAQTITILVQATKFPDNGGHGTYSVQVSGPVTLIR
jgi:hypothetical protein